MPDTRLPDRWFHDDAIVDLSPTAWKFLTFALMFCNMQGTDGHISDRQMRFLPIDYSQQDISDVIATGHLERVSGGYMFQNWTKGLGQSTAASIEQRREQNRINQAKSRGRKKSAVSDDVSDDDQGKDRKGKDRPGQEQPQPLRSHAGWPTAVPGPADDKEPWSA